MEGEKNRVPLTESGEREKMRSTKSCPEKKGVLVMEGS